ncbi:hypothetical protein CSKR_106660 [Clonorchis sinensis]|uniref:Uncharacterized protein n=1 Tax=Clonorchis sinensis TaxID=79923 RepID=A0A419Q0U8_CLOSI|nr:hypothetical protein CSKR_106660 [Clonorchis sinensis]
MLVKFVFPSRRSLDNREVCRVNLFEKTKSYTVEYLQAKVREVTNLKKNVVFKFYFKENSDFIELATDADVSNYFKRDFGDECPRVYVVPCPKSNVKPLNSFFNYCYASELPKITEKVNDRLTSSFADPWMTTPCKLCEKEDWAEERYTCIFCPNVVLCPQCFYTGYHPDHPIIVTRDTRAFSRQFLKLARVVVATIPW